MKVFKKGKVIISLEELVSLLNKKEWIYYRKRPVHPGVIEHMPLLVVLGGIDKRVIFQAMKRNVQ